jgi:hypothetical protein
VPNWLQSGLKTPSPLTPLVPVQLAYPVFDTMCQASPSVPTRSMFPLGSATVTPQLLLLGSVIVSFIPGQLAWVVAPAWLLLIENVKTWVVHAAAAPEQIIFPLASKPVTDWPDGHDMPSSPMIPGVPLGP